MKVLSFLLKKPRLYLFSAVFFSFSQSSAASSLNMAWKDLITVAHEYTSRGIPLNDVMQDALVFGSNEALTEKAVNLFTLLLENVFVTMRNRTNFETSRALRDVHYQLSTRILTNQYARHRIALAVFRNYKDWNVRFASSGDVDQCDLVVFVSFLNSLNKDFFSGLFEGTTPDVFPNDFNVLRTHIGRLVNIVKPRGLLVLARSGTNRAQHSVRSGMNAVARKARGAKKSVGRQLQRISFKNVFYTVGAGSAIAFFLMGSYAFIYRKKVLREFGVEVLKLGGGAKEVAKEAALLYTLPETRWDRIVGRVKDWVYNDPEIRRERAVKLRKELLSDTAKYMPAVSYDHDELTDLLIFAASNPQSVKPGMAARVKEEWVQDLRRRDLMLRQKKAATAEKTQEAKSFVQAAKQYLKAFGRKPFVAPQALPVAPLTPSSAKQPARSSRMARIAVRCSGLVSSLRQIVSDPLAPRRLSSASVYLQSAGYSPLDATAPLMQNQDNIDDVNLTTPLLKRSSA